jgi:5-methylthioadenosine/S-adenosylhomocysteine deaminase
MRIISADHVLPVSSEPIFRGAVVIEKDSITAVGARDEIADRFPDMDVEDFGAAAIIPGLVNCHSHLEITAMRGFLDDVEHDFAAWLLRLNDTRAKRLTEADIELAAVAGAAEGAAAGVTCFGDIGRNGKAGLEALKKAGLRGIVYQETNFSPDDRTADDDLAALVDKIENLRGAETDLVKVGVSPHSLYTVGPKLFSLIAKYALDEKLRISIHAAESKDEEQLMLHGTGFFTGFYEKFGVEWQIPHCSSIEFLERTGILAAGPLLAHCIRVSDNDIELIRSNSASIAHCPKSNAKFGHGWAPFEKFLDEGVKVGFGSDSVASNNVCDLLEEARFAVLGARNRPDTLRFISGKEALETATLGGARALGLADLVGSIEPGKQADLAVVSLTHLAQYPLNDVYAAIVHSSNGRDVVLTMVAGRDVYRNGSSTQVDVRELIEKMDAIRKKIH